MAATTTTKDDKIRVFNPTSEIGEKVRVIAGRFTDEDINSVYQFMLYKGERIVKFESQNVGANSAGIVIVYDPDVSAKFTHDMGTSTDNTHTVSIDGSLTALTAASELWCVKLTEAIAGGTAIDFIVTVEVSDPHGV